MISVVLKDIKRLKATYLSLYVLAPIAYLQSNQLLCDIIIALQLFIALFLVIPFIILEDSPNNANSFLITKPILRTHLLAAKFISIIISVYIPILIVTIASCYALNASTSLYYTALIHTLIALSIYIFFGMIVASAANSYLNYFSIISILLVASVFMPEIENQLIWGYAQLELFQTSSTLDTSSYIDQARKSAMLCKIGISACLFLTLILVYKRSRRVIAYALPIFGIVISISVKKIVDNKSINILGTNNSKTVQTITAERGIFKDKQLIGFTLPEQGADQSKLFWATYNMLDCIPQHHIQVTLSQFFNQDLTLEGNDACIYALNPSYHFKFTDLPNQSEIKFQFQDSLAEMKLKVAYSIRLDSANTAQAEVMSAQFLPSMGVGKILGLTEIVTANNLLSESHNIAHTIPWIQAYFSRVKGSYLLVDLKRAQVKILNSDHIYSQFTNGYLNEDYLRSRNIALPDLESQIASYLSTGSSINDIRVVRLIPEVSSVTQYNITINK